ncbi:MAG: outer membrane lipoprotein carrier protein LolA [Succinivibrio sp.]
MSSFIKLIVLTAIFFGVKLSFAVTLDEIKVNLNRSDIIRADFTQEKYLSNLNRTLKSSGVLYIVNEKNVIWEQLLPFEMDLVITDEKMLQCMDGQTDLITRDANPQVFDVSKLMMQIFSVNKDLDKHFDVSLSGSKDNFEMILTPKNELLKKAFKAIYLNGGKNLNKIVLTDTTGDKTSIYLKDTVCDAVLNAKEKSYLE